jgi:hypothetical protein
MYIIRQITFDLSMFGFTIWGRRIKKGTEQTQRRFTVFVQWNNPAWIRSFPHLVYPILKWYRLNDY